MSKELLSREMQQQLVDRLLTEFHYQMNVLSDSINTNFVCSLPHRDDVLEAIERGVESAIKGMQNEKS